VAVKKMKLMKAFGDARQKLQPIIEKEKASEDRSDLLVERLEALFSEFGDEALKILDGQ